MTPEETSPENSTEAKQAEYSYGETLLAIIEHVKEGDLTRVDVEQILTESGCSHLLELMSDDDAPEFDGDMSVLDDLLKDVENSEDLESILG